MTTYTESIPFMKSKGGRSAILEWMLTTDHKRIGILYFFTILSMFIVGMIVGLVIRLHLFNPAYNILGPQTYNAAFTLHGVIMIFLFVIPSIPASFGNIFLPILLGAEDVSFPRINLLSYYLYLVGIILAVISLFTGKGAPDTGWTFYVPFSEMTTTNVTMAAFAVFLVGFSSILTGLNFITTIHRLRAPGMSWTKMPLFAWSLYATAWIQILASLLPYPAVTLLIKTKWFFFPSALLSSRL